MPLVRHWKAMVAVALCGFVVLAAVFLAKPRSITVTIDFSTAPIGYQSYQAAVSQLLDSNSQKLFFTKDRLDVDPEAYFITRVSHDTTAGLKYFDISYPAPYLSKDNIDLFKGYFDADKRLNQSSQGNFTVSFSSTNRDKNVAKAIATSLIEDYVPACWDRMLLGEMIESGRRSNRTSIDISSLQIERNRLASTIGLLEEFQREYPSLIRSNLTLTDNMMPVEVQLMNARRRVKDIDDTIEQYYISFARFNAWQQFATALDALGINAVDKKEFVLYCNRAIEASKEAFIVDPALQGKAGKSIDLQSILDSDRVILEAAFQQIALSVDHDIKANRIEVLDAKRSLKTLVIAAVGVIFLAILSAYLVQAYSSIKRKIAEEK